MARHTRNSWFSSARCIYKPAWHSWPSHLDSWTHNGWQVKVQYFQLPRNPQRLQSSLSTAEWIQQYSCTKLLQTSINGLSRDLYSVSIPFWDHEQFRKHGESRNRTPVWTRNIVSVAYIWMKQVLTQCTSLRVAPSSVSYHTVKETSYNTVKPSFKLEPMTSSYDPCFPTATESDKCDPAFSMRDTERIVTFSPLHQVK